MHPPLFFVVPLVEFSVRLKLVGPIVKVDDYIIMLTSIPARVDSPGVEELAAKLQVALLEQGYLASLDYSHAFDHVTPRAITLGMKKLGLSENLANTLRDKWTN